MNTFDIHLDQDNELKFKVVVEGTDEAVLKYQLVLETDRMNYSFPGHIDNEDICVVIPPLEKILKEGTYSTRLEVIVDDRIFTPLAMSTNAKKQIKVMAESVSRARVSAPSVTAAVINTSTKKPKLTKASKESTIRKQSLNLESLSEAQIRKLAKIIARRKLEGKKK
jgi:hypothetical protein